MQANPLYSFIYSIFMQANPLYTFIYSIFIQANPLYTFIYSIFMQADSLYSFIFFKFYPFYGVKHNKLENCKLESFAECILNVQTKNGEIS